MPKCQAHLKWTLKPQHMHPNKRRRFHHVNSKRNLQLNDIVYMPYNPWLIVEAKVTEILPNNQVEIIQQRTLILTEPDYSETTNPEIMEMMEEQNQLD